MAFANTPKRSIRVVLLVAAAACAAFQARAEYRCGAPKSLFDQRACAAAQQGPNELRRYIQRMQAIESLYFFDYADERDFARWAAEARAEQPLVTRAVAPAQTAAGR